MDTERKGSLLAEAIRAREEERILEEERVKNPSPASLVFGVLLLPFWLAFKFVRLAWLVVLSIVLSIVQFIMVCVIIGRR